LIHYVKRVGQNIFVKEKDLAWLLLVEKMVI
jgi:hypothetical protein